MNPTCTKTNPDPRATPERAEPDVSGGIIPFADEPAGPAGETAAELPLPLAERDRVDEAFGPVAERESVADRELGIDRQNCRREGKYACPCCGQGTSRVLRVRVAHRPGWSGVCAVCAATLLARVPGTLVGGRVRPSRRRQRPVPGQAAHGFRRMDQNGYRRAG